MLMDHLFVLVGVVPQTPPPFVLVCLPPCRRTRLTCIATQGITPWGNDVQWDTRTNRSHGSGAGYARDDPRSDPVQIPKGDSDRRNYSSPETVTDVDAIDVIEDG
jgi:hypothetical protein